MCDWNCHRWNEYCKKWKEIYLIEIVLDIAWDMTTPVQDKYWLHILHLSAGYLWKYFGPGHYLFLKKGNFKFNRNTISSHVCDFYIAFSLTWLTKYRLNDNGIFHICNTGMQICWASSQRVSNLIINWTNRQTIGYICPYLIRSILKWHNLISNDDGRYAPLCSF